MTNNEKIANIYKNIGSKAKAAELAGITTSQLDRILKEQGVTTDMKNKTLILHYNGLAPLEPYGRQYLDYDLRVSTFWKRMLETNGEVSI